MPWSSLESVLKTDTEEKKLLNKVVIFVFFVNDKYSRCFITLRSNITVLKTEFNFL